MILTPEFGSSPDVAILPPASEALQDMQRAGLTWPEQAAHDSFRAQIEAHGEHVATVAEAVHSLPSPTMSLEQAAKSGIVTEGQVGRLYDTLSDILDDPERARLALYLPFEFLPDVSWQAEDPVLQISMERFTEAYMQAWYGLLSVHDVRENFVDGDVLEDEYRDGDLPRVVKAAHLIPELLERGLLSEGEVDRILRITDDELLKQSIAEGLAAFYGTTLPEAAVTSIPPEAMTEERLRWMAKKEQEEAIAAAAKEVAEAIAGDNLPREVIDQAASGEGGALASAILAEGIYAGIESAANTDEAVKLYDQYANVLAALWERDDAGIQDRLARVYRRLHRLGVVDEGVLAQRDVDLPTLTGPWSENLALFAEDVAAIQGAAGAIESHPELRELVYPVALVGGSRVKGYGERGSDIDINVFVKPGVPESARSRMRELLVQTFTSDGRTYEVTEFWLDEHDARLAVHDFEAPDKHTADSNWVHILFGTAWVGSQQAIRELHEKLLPNYFYDAGTDAYGRNQRDLYLERLEQDVLQYRLMHTGYGRHYPRYSAERSAAIDGASAFWDAGYRQLATQLFVDKVFLPKIV